MTYNLGSTPRWVVAHCGARDQYQLPIAFHEAGQLQSFVTDWYSPFDSPVLGSLLSHAPVRLRSAFAQRYRKDLPSSFVKDLKLDVVLNRIFSSDDRTNELDRRIGEYAARVASESGSQLLATSYYGWAAFPKLTKSTKRVLFQIHPHPGFLRELYQNQQEHDIGDGFRCEAEMKISDERLAAWGQESLDADIVLATSTFTLKSLLHAGVKPERIRIVPYGVDSERFRNDLPSPSGKPKILFVGQPTSRKGFANLLNVWERLDNREAELHIASGSVANRRDLRSGGPVIWYGRLTSADLVQLMNRSDLLVLPSIAEGFGLVLLEALSCGTPILCSDATAGPDILKGWDEHFVFPSGDWDGLVSRMDYWLTNIFRLRKLRSSARNLAESLSWEKFRENIRYACNREFGSYEHQ